MSTLQLGGRVFDLQDGQAGGSGADKALRPIGVAIEELREEFGDRQGLRLTLFRPNWDTSARLQVLVWKWHADAFVLMDIDDSVMHCNSMADLFSQLSVLLTRYSIEWDVNS